MNLRSKSKAKVAAKTVLSIATDNLDLSEDVLRKLPRAELQKLAMKHKFKANVKSELIIQNLLSLRVPTKKRQAPAGDDFEQRLPSKRLKREVMSAEIASPSARENSPAQAGEPEPGPSNLPASPEHHPYDKTQFSDTSSEMTEEEQNDFDTPVSSRAGSPPPAHVRNLKRCVKILREVSDQDVALLAKIEEVRGTAAAIHRRARDVRDLVTAERGRRERMETYFRYWRNMDSTWDREWMYGEKRVAESKIRLEELDGPAGPPTLPVRKPTVLTPEEVREKREAIISRQEAERRELEALEEERATRC